MTHRISMEWLVVEDAFIGAVHRIAARLDDRFELVSGVSSDPGDAFRRKLGMAQENTPIIRRWHLLGQREMIESKRLSLLLKPSSYSCCTCIHEWESMSSVTNHLQQIRANRGTAGTCKKSKLHLRFNPQL